MSFFGLFGSRSGSPSGASIISRDGDTRDVETDSNATVKSHQKDSGKTRFGLLTPFFSPAKFTTASNTNTPTAPLNEATASTTNTPTAPLNEGSEANASTTDKSGGFVVESRFGLGKKGLEKEEETEKKMDQSSLRRRRSSLHSRHYTMSKDEFVSFLSQTEKGQAVLAGFKTADEAYSNYCTNVPWREELEKDMKLPLYSESEFAKLWKNYGLHRKKVKPEEAYKQYWKNEKFRKIYEQHFQDIDGSLLEEEFFDRYWRKYGNREINVNKPYSNYLRSKEFRKSVSDMVNNPPLFTREAFVKWWKQAWKHEKNLSEKWNEEDVEGAYGSYLSNKESRMLVEKTFKDSIVLPTTAKTAIEHSEDISRNVDAELELLRASLPTLPPLKTQVIKYVDHPNEFGFLTLAQLTEEQAGLTQMQAENLFICWNILQKWLLQLAVHIRNLNEREFSEQTAKYGEFPVLKGKLNWYQDWDEEQRISREKMSRDIRQRVENIYFSRLKDKSYGFDEVTNHIVPLRAIHAYYMFLMTRSKGLYRLEQAFSMLGQPQFWGMLIWYWYYQLDGIAKHFPICDAVQRFRDAYEVHINNYYDSIREQPLLRNANRDSSREDAFGEWRKWIEEGNSKGQAPGFERLFITFCLIVKKNFREKALSIYPIAMYLCRNEEIVDWNLIQRLRYIVGDFGPGFEKGKEKILAEEVSEELLEVGFVGLGEVEMGLPGMIKKGKSEIERKQKKADRIQAWSNYLCVRFLGPGTFYIPPARRQDEDTIPYENRVKFIPGHWNFSYNSFCPIEDMVVIPESTGLPAMLRKPILLLEDFNKRIEDSDTWAKIVVETFMEVEKTKDKVGSGSGWDALPHFSRLVGLEHILRAFKAVYDNRLVLAMTLHSFQTQIVLHTFIPEEMRQSYDPQTDTDQTQRTFIRDFFLHHLDFLTKDIFPHVEPYTQLCLPEIIENEKKRQMMRERYASTRALFQEQEYGSYKSVSEYRQMRQKISENSGKVAAGYYREYLKQVEERNKLKLQKKLATLSDEVKAQENKVKAYKREIQSMKASGSGGGSAGEKLKKKKEDLADIMGKLEELKLKKKALSLVAQGLNKEAVKEEVKKGK